MILIDFTRYHALLLDLDGVITRTDVLHAAAWKRLFDDYLAQEARATSRPVQPFDAKTDYRLYLDGKPRKDGVKSFLDSRGMAIPLGSPTDGADSPTIHGLARRKDEHFEALLRQTGVQVYAGTARFLGLAKAHGLKTAVVSASHHCKEVLDASGLAALFDARVDGHDLDRLPLRGKPAPDTFLEAARRLRVPPDRAIVVEDAQAGVEAARTGGFGLVIGVNRRDQAEALRRQGAGVVVNDLAELLPAARAAS